MKQHLLHITLISLILLLIAFLLGCKDEERFSTLDFYIDPNDTTDCVFQLPEGTRAVSVNDLRNYYKRFNLPEPNESENISWPKRNFLCSGHGENHSPIGLRCERASKPNIKDNLGRYYYYCSGHYNQSYWMIKDKNVLVRYRPNEPEPNEPSWRKGSGESLLLYPQKGSIGEALNLSYNEITEKELIESLKCKHEGKGDISVICTCYHTDGSYCWQCPDCGKYVNSKE